MKATQRALWYHSRRFGTFKITCGSDGILAITPHWNFLTRGPVLEEVNAAGAGDATSAALMWRLSLGDDWSTSLRWAAATMLTEATAESKFDVVQELLPRVEQRPLGFIQKSF